MTSVFVADRFLRRLPAIAVASLFVAVSIANRPASQIPIGPAYLLEGALAAAILLRPVRVARALIRFWPALVLLLVATAWLGVEAATGSLDRLALRRAATGLYALTPAVLWVYRREALLPLTKWPGVAALLAVVATVVLPDVSPTTSAVVLLGLGLASMRAPGVPFRFAQASVCAGGFAAVGSAVLFPGGSLMRTPFATLALVGMFFVGRLLLRSMRRRRIQERIPAFALFASLVLVLSLTAAPVRAGLGSMVAAAAGLTGSDAIADLALSLNPDRQRGRGDSIGTATDRVRFWGGIVSYGSSSGVRFAVGAGHERSFFQATRPGESFVDAEFLEPHNSFLGVFFRYGIVGLLALLGLLAIVVHTAWRADLDSSGRAWVLESLVVAMTFAFFEVVLEVPYGAVAFWTLVLLPVARADA